MSQRGSQGFRGGGLQPRCCQHRCLLTGVQGSVYHISEKFVLAEIEEFTHSRRLLSKIFDEEPAATFQFLSTSLDFLPPAIFQAMTIHLWRRRSQQNHTNFIPYQNISKLTSMLNVVLHFMFYVLSDRISFLSTFCSFIFNNLRLGLLQNNTNLIFKYFFNAKSSTQNIQ